MKLYLWPEVFPDYTYGCAFAISPSKEQAIELVMAGHAFYGEWMLDPSPNDYKTKVLEDARAELRTVECQELPLDQPFGFAISGGG